MKQSKHLFYLFNILPTKSIMNMALYKLFFHKNKNICHMKLIGRITYALIDYDEHNKINKKNEKYSLINFSDNSKSHICINHEMMRLIIYQQMLLNDIII